mmetsp:Transcript_20589/g.45106  ORF Transcript_20589/g.45106 Transcript_20589/m.45106 type:complete len:84 (+) Transcript_20589:391-642(+)
MYRNPCSPCSMYRNPCNPCNTMYTCICLDNAAFTPHVSSIPHRSSSEDNESCKLTPHSNSSLHAPSRAHLHGHPTLAPCPALP